MRRLLVLALLAPLSGCRISSINGEPEPRDYVLYNAFLDQASSAYPADHDFVVENVTLALNQNELQYQQCLPRRMESVFDSAPSTTLPPTASPDWLKLADHRAVTLHAAGTPLAGAPALELFHLSRVAFTRSGYDAYLWVDHRTCNTDPKETGCGTTSGVLLHAKRANNTWTFEETTCQIIKFP